MICHAIICSLLISDFQIKLLKEQNPTDELWLDIPVGKEVLQCNMISVYYHFSTNQVGSELVNGEHHCQKFLLRCRIIQLNSSQCFTCITYGIMLLSVPRERGPQRK
jgi:hypothetical protein